jgi:hypothetical protein
MKTMRWLFPQASIERYGRVYPRRRCIQAHDRQNIHFAKMGGLVKVFHGGAACVRTVWTLFA